MRAARPGVRPLLRTIFVRQRRRAGLGALCWASHQICEAMVPVVFGLVIDRAVRTGDGVAMALSVLGIFALFGVLTMSWRTGEWFMSRAVLEEAHTLRQGSVRRVLGSDQPDSQRQTGEQLSIATSDAQATAEVLEVVGWMAAASVGIVTAAVVLLRIDWVLGLGILVGVPAIVFGLNALGPLIERRTADQQQFLGLAAATAADLLTGLRPLRGFGGVPPAVDRYRRVSRQSLTANVGAIRALATFRGATTVSSGLLLAAVAGAAGAFALEGRLSVGELIAVVGLAGFISDPVNSLASCVHTLATARASASRVAELLGEEVATSGVRQPGSAGALVLEDVSGPGLDGFGLVVEPGEMVGVVTGSVVTAATLSAVLSGQLEPDSGTVRLGGRLLSDLDDADRRAQILVEPHRVDLFGATLREALLTGPERSDAELRDALDAAALDELDDREHDLLDHPLLDHGVNLSGGQRQRLALARALTAERPVLVLRDPTTAVDAVTESAMASGLRAARVGDLATLIVTTSPPLLARCDRVVFLPGDGSARCGTHAELRTVPAYADVVLR